MDEGVTMGRERSPSGVPEPMSEIAPPPVEWMRLVCGDRPDLEDHFHELGGEITERLRAHGMLHAGSRFLDVGCGCGRIARCLVAEELASYTGFDRHPGMIAWCQRHITSKDPRFTFIHVDVKSAYTMVDGHRGAIDARELRFPFGDGAFDHALLASVFTHMPLDETSSYLHELRRVVSDAGNVLLTVFFADHGEPWVSDYNYFYRPSDFFDRVAAAGFQWQPLDNNRPGSIHNWFELKAAGLDP